MNVGLYDGHIALATDKQHVSIDFCGSQIKMISKKKVLSIIEGSELELEAICRVFDEHKKKNVIALWW